MRIGPYEVLAKAGEGGMGAVYRARDPRLGRDLAIKVMSVAASTDAARFATEMQALARLSHPHVVAVHAAGVDGGKPFVAMQWVDGEDLRARLRRAGTFPEHEARRVVAAVARALEYAHGQGVVHRDVKPANVLVTADGRVLLADFGLARIVGRETRVTLTGEIVGTPAYAAPEQAAGDTAAIGPATDVWALGALLFELLTGHGPFTRGSLVGTLEAILHAPAPSCSTERPDLDPGLDALVRRCLDKAPGKRPTAGEVAATLEAGLRAPAPAVTPARLVPALAAAAILAVGGATLALATRARRAPDVAAPEVAATPVETAHLELEAPRDEVTSPVRVRGWVAPPRPGLRVRLGAEVVTPRDDGTFQVELKLEVGDRVVEARALRGDHPVTPPTRATVKVRPTWYLDLPSPRPPWPLPAGLTMVEPGRWKNHRDGTVLRWVPPGAFVVTSQLAPDRQVDVEHGFFVSASLVTHEQVRAFERATGRRAPLHPKPDDPGYVRAAIDWVDAQEYCRWAGVRLATELEWYRAREHLRGDWAGTEPEWLQEWFNGYRLGKKPAGEPTPRRQRQLARHLAPSDDPPHPPVAAPTIRDAIPFRVVLDAAGAARRLPAAQWTVEAFSLTPDPTNPPQAPKAAIRDLRLAATHSLGPISLDHLDLRFENEGPGQLLLPPGERSLFPKEWFVVVATTRLTLPAGRYTLYARSDDGVRVFLDGRPAIDAWVHRVAGPWDLWPFYVPTPRTVEVRVEYCELVGSASLTAGVCPD